jgi:hypothetical protein
MEAGAVLCHRGRVRLPAGMNEAWRIFCSTGKRLFEFYECRGTRFVASRSQVKVYKVLKEALARSRYKVVGHLIRSRSKLKKM